MEDIKKRIVEIAANMDLKEIYSTDRITCDAILMKVESMLRENEIKILSGSL